MNIFSSFKFDFKAGVTVFLIALPLCLGISLASGAPLYSGLISGVVGGLTTSLISKSVFSVSGPAAGLSTIVAAAIVSLGDFQLFLLTVIIAGVFQLLLGIFKLGFFVNYFPSSVIKGMLAAIGLILIIKQLPLIFGSTSSSFWTDLFSLNYSKITPHFTKGAIIISIICLSISFLLKLKILKKLTIIPSALFVVIIGILLNILFDKFVPSLKLNSNQLVNIPFSIFSDLKFPNFKMLLSNFDLYQYGLTIGIVATLETLLSVKAIDKLDPQNRITPINNELIAQGIGNVSCGLLGGLPITAVIVRGSANIDAGAKSKLSAKLHSILLLFAVLLIPSILNKIPYASLAVILLLTGYNLTKPKLYINVWKIGINQFLPFIITLLVILIEDLLIGVAIGLLTALIIIIKNNLRSDFDLRKESINQVTTNILTLHTNVTFLDKIKLSKVLYSIDKKESIVIDGSKSSHVDYDVIEMISEFDNYATDNGIELKLIGIKKVEIIAAH